MAYDTTNNVLIPTDIIEKTSLGARADIHVFNLCQVNVNHTVCHSIRMFILVRWYIFGLQTMIKTPVTRRIDPREISTSTQSSSAFRISSLRNPQYNAIPPELPRDSPHLHPLYSDEILNLGKGINIDI